MDYESQELEVNKLNDQETTRMEERERQERAEHFSRENRGKGSDWWNQEGS